MASPRALEAVLRDLGSQVRRGGGVEEPPARLPVGWPQLDRLLGGGLPRGRLCEIAGPLSSGRTSLALSLLAETTRAGQLAGVVDPADSFDPASAGASGVALGRVLWARPRGPREALRCSERLLEAHGFALVLLDGAPPRVPWLRLARAAAGTNTALVLLSEQRVTGSCAEVALETRGTGPRFGGTPPLLEGLTSEVVLVRHRALAPAALRVQLHLAAA